MNKLEERPPYIRFEFQAVEDRARALETGQYAAKDVAFVIITPAGSRDELIYVAEEWLDRQKEAARLGRLNPAWLRHYQETYKAFLQNEEAPLIGTPLTHWPGLSPAQYSNLKSANLRTVEDVATMNEEAIRRVGMGGRQLQIRAQAFLDAVKNGTAKVGEETAVLRAENARLNATVEDLQNQMKELRSLLPQPQNVHVQPAESVL